MGRNLSGDPANAWRASCQIRVPSGEHTSWRGGEFFRVGRSSRSGMGGLAIPPQRTALKRAPPRGAGTRAQCHLVLDAMAILHRLWGSQSWLQPAFSRPCRATKSLMARKSRLKGGCGEDCPPHNFCRIRSVRKTMSAVSEVHERIVNPLRTRRVPRSRLRSEPRALARGSSEYETVLEKRCSKWPCCVETLTS